MNRFQKKCVVASAGFHLLLFSVLLVGPAFLMSSNDKADDLPVIDFIPLKTVDAAVSGGGNPRGGLPAAAPVARPQPPAPAPEPVRQVAPRPEPAPREVVHEVRRPEPDREALEPAKPPRHQIRVNTTLVRRDTGERSRELAREREQARARAAAEQAREAAEQRHRISQAIGQTVAGIQSGLSGSTAIELKGPGGGGVPYANWMQAVKSVYANAWVVPNGVTDDSAVTVASVTIARDGTVVSARIVRSSGNGLVDQSVQEVLDRVRFAAPLPDGAKESERTVNISFNVKAKLFG